MVVALVIVDDQGQEENVASFKNVSTSWSPSFTGFRTNDSFLQITASKVQWTFLNFVSDGNLRVIVGGKLTVSVCSEKDVTNIPTAANEDFSVVLER